MVSGGYKGANININDWLVVGALAVGGYFLYKTVIKPTSDATGGVGSGIGTIGRESGESFGAVSDLFQGTVGKITDFVTGKNNTSSSKIAPSYKNINEPISALNPVLKVESSGTAYNMPVVTVTTKKGGMSSIVAQKNIYYENLGIGFDSKGQGYSSIFAGNKQPSLNTTQILPTTKSNPTSIFTQKF